jgi:HSP20 family protein
MITCYDMYSKGDLMAGLIPMEEIKRLRKRMDRIMDDISSELETRYPEEMKALQDRMNRLMEEFERQSPSDSIAPLADVRDTDEALIVAMDLPGVSKDDIELTVSENELHVKASREVKKDKDYHSQERICARFERLVKLPVVVKGNEAKAKLKDGVLEITLPKEVVVSRKRIIIE